MIHSVRFKCVLDTNVIYPLWTRDLLLWFAFYDLYTPKWSNNIFSEWIDVNQRLSILAFRKLVLNKKNPPYDEYDVLEIFRNNGLKRTADYLHSLI